MNFIKFLNISIFLFLFTSYDFVKSMNSLDEVDSSQTKVFKKDKSGEASKSWIRKNPKKFIAIAVATVLAASVIGVGVHRVVSKKWLWDKSTKTNLPSSTKSNLPSPQPIKQQSTINEPDPEALKQEKELEQEFNKVFGNPLKGDNIHGFLTRAYLAGYYVSNLSSDYPRENKEVLKDKIRKFIDKEAIERARLGNSYLPTPGDDDIYMQAWSHANTPFKEADRNRFTKQELENISDKLKQDFDNIKSPVGNAEIPEPLFDKMLLIRLRTERIRNKK